MRLGQASVSQSLAPADRVLWGAFSLERIEVDFRRPGSMGRPPGPACRSSDASVSIALMTAVDPQRPGYLSHRKAAAAPVDRLTQRQSLLLGHRPQRLPSALLSVPDESIALTERGQHRDR